MEKFNDGFSKTLAEIRAGDIMAVFAALYGIIIIGGAIVIAQSNPLLGLFVCVFSPVFILLLTVLTNMGLDKLKEGLDKKEKKSEVLNKIYPKFVRRTYHAEYRVSDNRDAVKQYVIDFYNQNNWMIESDGFIYITKFLRLTTPNKEDVLQEHGIIVGGVKLDKTVYETKIDKMFYVSFLQGQENISVVRFDTDEEDIALFSEDLLDELKKSYTVKVLESNIKTKRRKAK